MTKNAADVAEANWILDFCAGCNTLVWMDLLDVFCPECLGS